ncbi:MAG: hypothetical protein OMM_13125 [Candidatus Magnetoglobus multicellularis str. Araruama]|uniref:Uncharacterized protein n=1 Tax=Candidatus Magnetoglobus multicellularis str. Araruama TaxID=890399 RepID=A0A1V1NUC8_9BACT|nr:MAG: hypothetical protein OMM_13125 [Candidatus Magnetoglobus multicellularis str. Araruama]
MKDQQKPIFTTNLNSVYRGRIHKVSSQNLNANNDLHKTISQLNNDLDLCKRGYSEIANQMDAVLKIMNIFLQFGLYMVELVLLMVFVDILFLGIDIFIRV